MSLHSRLIQPAEGEVKIPIHAFVSALREWQNGYITQQEIIDFFSLSASEQTQGVTIKNLLNAAPDKIQFLRALKDWLYLGELGDVDSRYTSAANLNTRLENEVTDQGGTLP